MKRALTTFGNPFGLALYDKAQHGVRGKAQNHNKSNRQSVSWIVLSAEGEVISLHEDPVDYCKALRQVIEASASPERLRALWGRNSVTIEMLRANLRDLRTEAGEHYADILLSLYQRQLKELYEEQEADQAEAEAVQKAIQAGTPDQEVAQAQAEAVQKTATPDTSGQQVGHANGGEVPNESVLRANGADSSKEQKGANAAGQIDKSALPISAPRRIRDKDHLRFVASQPCLVCGRSPGHAHHIRYAQPRAMGRKVSDEWTVPLCATHHRALHTVGDEQKWWKERGINPIIHAEQLWRERWGEGVDLSTRARELIRPIPG
jgi:flagellin-specific chaperone FliS